MKKAQSVIDQGGTETDAEIRREVGRRIAEMRRRLDLSARLVAERLGISREAVTHIETGRNNISAVSLWKLATLFHCQLADFFPDVPDGFALTDNDARKIGLAGGERAARWARTLFPKKGR